MTIVNFAKQVVITIMTWMCISIGLQLYFQTSASISPRVRKMMYKQQQVDKALAQTYTHPTTSIEYTPDTDIYDHISILIVNTLTTAFYPFVLLSEWVYGTTDAMVETFVRH